MFGIKALNLLRRQILRNWQIALKSSVPIVFINWQYGVNAAGADKEFLESVSLTKFQQDREMTMIEVLVRNENLIVDWFGGF